MDGKSDGEDGTGQGGREKKVGRGKAGERKREGRSGRKLGRNSKKQRESDPEGTRRQPETKFAAPKLRADAHECPLCGGFGVGFPKPFPLSVRFGLIRQTLPAIRDLSLVGGIDKHTPEWRKRKRK